MEPLVSILIPTCNRPQYIYKSVMSAVLQSYRNIEIIITDNSDNDETRFIVNDIIKRNENVKFLYFKNESNIGPVLNWGKSLNLSSGRFAVLLPDDDYFINPFYIEDAVTLLCDTKSDIVITSCMFYYPDECKLPEYKYKKVIRGKNFFENFWTSESPVPHIANLFNADLVKGLNCFSDNDILFSDLECWLKISAHSDIRYYPIPSVCYKFHSSNIVLNMDGDIVVKNAKFLNNTINYLSMSNSSIDKSMYCKFVWKYIKYAHNNLNIKLSMNQINDILKTCGFEFDYNKFMMFMFKLHVKKILKLLWR